MTVSSCTHQACYKLLTACSKLIPTTWNKQCEHNLSTVCEQTGLKVCTNLYVFTRVAQLYLTIGESFTVQDILQCPKYNISLLIHNPVIFVRSVKFVPYLSPNTRRHTVHTSITTTNHDHVLITCICDVNLQISWRKQKINVPPDSTVKLDFVSAKPCETCGKPYILQQKDMLLTSLRH